MWLLTRSCVLLLVGLHRGYPPSTLQLGRVVTNLELALLLKSGVQIRQVGRVTATLGGCLQQGVKEQMVSSGHGRYGGTCVLDS